MCGNQHLTLTICSATMHSICLRNSNATKTNQALENVCMNGDHLYGTQVTQKGHSDMVT